MNLHAAHNIIASILGVFSNFRLAIAFETSKNLMTPAMIRTQQPYMHPDD